MAVPETTRWRSSRTVNGRSKWTPELPTSSTQPAVTDEGHSETAESAYGSSFGPPDTETVPRTEQSPITGRASDRELSIVAGTVYALVPIQAPSTAATENSTPTLNLQTSHNSEEERHPRTRPIDIYPSPITSQRETQAFEELQLEPPDIDTTQHCVSVRPCYGIILLAAATVLGSLAPALWYAFQRNNMSEGFTLAQYILGAGVFVTGSVTAIHSKTCTCWRKQGRR